MALV
jgi:hypothetical protein